MRIFPKWGWKKIYETTTLFVKSHISNESPLTNINSNLQKSCGSGPLFFPPPSHQRWLSSQMIHWTNGIFTYTWMVDFYGKLVGKYTVRPMDPMGLQSREFFFLGRSAIIWGHSLAPFRGKTQGVFLLRVFLGCIGRNVLRICNQKCYTCKYIYISTFRERESSVVLVLCLFVLLILDLCHLLSSVCCWSWKTNHTL